MRIMLTVLRFIRPILFAVALPCALAQTPSSNAPPNAGLPDGLNFPKAGTVYALDQDGANHELRQLHASEIVSNSQAGKNFARGMVYMNQHASFQVNGSSAAVHLASLQPSLYVRINTDDPDLIRRRIHLIRLQPTADRRTVSDYKQNVFGGQRTKHYDDIAITKADAEPDVWLKVTPEQPLTPGEYAIVFMPKDAIANPDAIYDFSVATDNAKPTK